jgi:hypothetical protein
MDKIYFDWSQRRGVVAIVVSGDGSAIPATWPTLADMADARKGNPTIFIGEATFESFLSMRRQAFVDRCASEGHQLFTTPARLTPRHRRAMGLLKSDENDAIAIMSLSNNPARRSGYHAPNVIKSGLRERANRQLMILRASGDKESWAQALADRLPAPESLPEIRRKALCDGKKYNLVKVAAVGVATANSANQRDFDFLSGLYAHAYPSQIRADLMHWGWAGGSKRGKLVKELDPSGETDKDVPVVPSKRVDGLTLTDYRREIRWLYRQLKPLVTEAG